jgi:hypothetical protein
MPFASAPLGTFVNLTLTFRLNVQLNEGAH